VLPDPYSYKIAQLGRFGFIILIPILFLIFRVLSPFIWAITLFLVGA
jgi:hypothetical protein